MPPVQDNPLLNFSALPRFDEIAPPHAAAAVDAALAAAADAARQTAAETAAPTWDNTVMPLEAADERVSRVWNQVQHMHAVMSTAAWRAAHNDNLAKIAAHYSALGQNAGLYRRLRALCESPDFAALPAVRRKIVADNLRDFELSGVALPDDKKAIFRQNSERLAMLAARFEENLLAATNAFTLDVGEEGDLGDMPADLRATARRAAADAGADGWHFSLQPPSYAAFMRYVRPRALRERMYRAYNARASELGAPEHDNTPVMTEILSTRRQQAALLGFADYAEMALQQRMTTDAAAVEDFLRDLAARARPFADREVEELRAFAAESLDIGDLAVWDVPYAAEKLRQRRFDFSAAEVRLYLREERVLEGLFACIKRLFGVTARAAKAPLWREDARYLELRDADGALIGGLYLDLYARGEKRGGAWMADALSRYRAAGRLQLPLAHVNCNFTKPADGGAALLNWDEAVTLFHEFGHALHHLLTEVDEYSAAGISGVEWDAVELPSQWLENFIWHWDVLRPMTAHAQTGAEMPRALFDKISAARRFHAGMWLLRQLEFALFDLRLHKGEGGALAAVLAEVRRLTALLPLPADNRFACGFSHIFAGGYAAGYYSYLWAEMLSADIFAMFAAAGDVLDADLGGRFRREVLAVGGGRPAMESFAAMRGRAPDIAPLLAHYGLSA